MRAILAVSLFLLASLAGCTAQDAPIKTLGSDDPDATPTTTGTNATAPNETEPNTPPTASLAANRTNGSAPLSVTFNLEGEDSDGDVLNWTLDADGNGTVDRTGTSLPAELSFLYNETGNYTATLTVTDGNATATATVAITVEEAAAGGGKEDLWVRWDAEGMCHAKDAFDVGPIWLHDRPGEGEPFGLVPEGEGGGTWIYEESNDVEGLQVGGPDEIDAYVDCLNPDTLIF